MQGLLKKFLSNNKLGLLMGADAFHAFYGLRYEVADADEVDELDEKNDPRLAAAKKGRLHVCTGRMTDGEPYFLFIGRHLGMFGVEGETEKSFDMQDLSKQAEETASKLQEVGLAGEPRLWFQLEAQY